MLLTAAPLSGRRGAHYGQDGDAHWISRTLNFGPLDQLGDRGQEFDPCW
jgi:hypothetical protein